jgi:hypothetical protein
MGLATKRKVTPRGAQGASKSIVIPSKLKIGKVATIAANRLMVVDPRGEISENDLLDFLEEHIEPNFWPWLKEKQNEKEAGAKAHAS